MYSLVPHLNERVRGTVGITNVLLNDVIDVEYLSMQVMLCVKEESRENSSG